MAESFQATTAVLDKNVFDFGYHIADSIPAVWKVSVAREYQMIQAGQTVNIVVHICDNMSTYGRRYPFNPAVYPVMILFDPLGNVIGPYEGYTFDPFASDALTMDTIATLADFFTTAQIGTGQYSFTYTTHDDALPGLYSSRFFAVNGTAQMWTRKQGVYTILDPLDRYTGALPHG